MFLPVLALALSISLQSVLCLGQLIGIGSAQRCVPVEGDKVSICPGTTVPVVFTNRVSSSDRKSNEPKLQVMSDVMVGGYVVIAKGVKVQHSMEAASAHMFAHPGSLFVDVVGVPTVTGDTVALVGTTRAYGDLFPGCGDLACYLLPPTEAKIKPGTLISAVVEKTVQLDYAALMKQNKQRRNSTQNVARVCLYSMKLKYSRSFEAPRVRVHIDGKLAGRFESHQYACASLAPGTHHLRADKAELNIEVAAGRDYFVRIEGLLPDGMNLDVTDGLESEGELLRPAHFNQGIADNCVQ